MSKEKKGWFTETETRYGKEMSFNYGKLIKLIAVLVVSIFLVILLNPISCVGRTERGVRTMFGAVVGDDVIMPGIMFRMPIVGGVVTRSITPIETKVSIKLNQNAAVSADTQEIGVEAKIFWRYDEKKIPMAIKQYQLSDIERILSATMTEQLKTIIGQYTVFDLGKNTSVIAAKTLADAQGRIFLPIEVLDFTVSDFDWSAEVDKIVEQKITAMASVDRAKAEADRSEQEQRRVSIEAEAQARAEVARSEGRLRAAQNERDALIAEGQGIAERNRLISINQAQMREQWRHDEQMAYYNKWNGVLVPNGFIMTAAGTIVPMNAPAQGAR